jgi:hypothetical protein
MLDPACEVGKTLGGKAVDVVTAPVRYAAGGAVDMMTSWVADSAVWLVGRVVNFIDSSTSPDLDADWFTERYRFMVGLAALVLLPMLLLAAIRAVVTQDVSQLLRSFFLYLPLAILGTFIAVFLTGALLTATDALSASVAGGIAGDTNRIFDSVGEALSHSLGTTSPGIPSFAIFFGALLLIIGSFIVWLELLVRSAAVTVSVFFLPLMLAGLVWPTTARWTRRLVETLVALILSKFVIVAVISLATAAMADPGGGGFGTVMGGAALMLMAALAPVALLKLMPVVEGAAMTHLDGMGRKPVDSFRPGGGANHAISIMRSKVNPTRVAAAGATKVPAAAGVAAGTRASMAVTKGVTGKAAKGQTLSGKSPDRTSGSKGGTIDNSVRPRANKPGKDG